MNDKEVLSVKIDRNIKEALIITCERYNLKKSEIIETLLLEFFKEIEEL